LGVDGYFLHQPKQQPESTPETNQTALSGGFFMVFEH
jgi:hypothetical protein